MMMNWTRLTVAGVLALVLLLTVTGCPKARPPETPGRPIGPDSAYQGAPTRFEVMTTQAQNKEVRYVINWGDASIETTETSYPSGERAYVYHAWRTPGHYSVKVLAVLAEDPNKTSDWSEPTSIRILPNSAPLVPTMRIPLVAVINVPAWFSATTTDPDGDSVGFRFRWGDGNTGIWSDSIFPGDSIGWVPSGGIVRDSHTYTRLGKVAVSCQARDKKGTLSEWSRPETLVVGEAGAVTWWWWSDKENEYLATGSPVIVMDGTTELIYTTVEGGTIRAITTQGRTRRTGTPYVPEEENEFTGHPVYCPDRQHIIVGNEDGELYAFNLSLSKVWNWPGKKREDSLTYIPWGTVAVNGDKIYAPRDNDTLYYFTDNGTTVTLNARYRIPGMVGAPVIDAGGNVYIGTDSGYLYKLPPNLASPSWKKMLRQNNEIHPPAIGADGNLYCGSSSGRVFSVRATDGAIRWTAILDAEVTRVVVSPTAVFAGTGSGKMYCLNPATGAIIWSKQHGTDDIVTSPILAGDYLYYQDYADVLYCIRQSDGELVWACNCPDYFSGKKSARRGKPDTFEGQPAILSNGNIIVIGEDALYCVAGYKDKLLMPDAPWPKWQRDAYNRGKAGAK